MGVQGLWSLLQPVARPIKIETLEGKRLAIDSSLWLYHFQMAMRDKEGRTLSNAHILGFLWRILKLLFHGVRPVFVFDGGAPVMKRKTLSGRKARKQGAKESHARTAEKLLAAQMRQAALRHVAEGNPASSTSAQPDAQMEANTVYYDDLQAGRPKSVTSASPAPGPSREGSGSPSKPRKDWHKDPYALPEMEKDLNQLSAANGRKGKRKDYRFATEDELRAVMNTIAPEDLDTTSELFVSLPPELQYELVGDLRTQSRMTSYKRLQSMLATAPTPIDFSRAQIAGLKTRNTLTQKVLTVTDEIGSANIKVPIRVAGERNKEYVLVRNPGAEGGFVLGVRDAGNTQAKAIDVDHEHQDINITDDEDDPDSGVEMEMDEVEIPAATEPAPRDPEALELLKVVDPEQRKQKALELLQARARYHAKQKRKEAGIDEDDDCDTASRTRLRRPRDSPLFMRPRGLSLSASAGEVLSDEENFVVLSDDELSNDEADDLARALAESRDTSNIQHHPSQTLANLADEEMDEDDFEDVQPQTAAPLLEVTPQLLQTDASPQTRMDELAALVKRRGADARGKGAAAPPPPRKSLAGSLRMAQRSTLPDAVAPTLPKVTVPTPAPTEEPLNPRRARMGPPSRSASQQRLDTTLPSPAIADLPQQKESKQIPPKSPSPAVSETKHPPAPVQQEAQEEEKPAETELTVVETLAAVAAGSGINDEIQEATHPNAPTDAREESVAEDTVKAEVVDADEIEIVPTGTVRRQASAPAEEQVVPVTVDNVPSAVAEVASPPQTVDASVDDVEEEEVMSRQGTPLDWSPSPEPVVLGADGFPLPTAEELDALDAEDEDEIARLNADQNEFVAFLSATKGRSLMDVQREVEGEVNALRAEFANSRRTEEDITKQMAQEIQMMLRLFGLPYITAPMEAEAQCAELVSRRLVDGIITDDSDVFLFGGTRIYKNMFNNNKIVECFLLSDMQRELGLDREKLVRLAYYLGSDYTEGLAGVGPVVAMELLALFPGQDGLLKFREWWLRVQMGKDTEQDTRGKTMRRIKKNLRNKVHLEPTWPQAEVLDAYYEPEVDESDEPFAWGLPDLDSLRTFLGEYLHWPVPKTDQYLLPIIERQNARNKARGNQSTLDRNGFFDTSAGTGVYAGRKKITYGSNRLQDVINGFRAANAPTKRNKPNPSEAEEVLSSSDEDDNEVQITAGPIQLNVSEELLGKEMAKKKPIVRRENALPTQPEERLAELDAAIAALEGTPAEPPSVAAKKPARKRAKVLTETGGANVVESTAAIEVASSSSSEADEWRPTTTKKRSAVQKAKDPVSTTGKARGKGRAAAATPSRGRGRGGRATLHAARNMSLDDVHALPESRSPSVDPANLRARSRRSASSTSSTR